MNFKLAAVIVILLALSKSVTGQELSQTVDGPIGETYRQKIVKWEKDFSFLMADTNNNKTVLIESFHTLLQNDTVWRPPAASQLATWVVDLEERCGNVTGELLFRCIFIQAMELERHNKFVFLEILYHTLVVDGDHSFSLRDALQMATDFAVSGSAIDRNRHITAGLSKRILTHVEAHHSAVDVENFRHAITMADGRFATDLFTYDAILQRYVYNKEILYDVPLSEFGNYYNLAKMIQIKSKTLRDEDFDVANWIPLANQTLFQNSTPTLSLSERSTIRMFMNRLIAVSSDNSKFNTELARWTEMSRFFNDVTKLGSNGRIMHAIAQIGATNDWTDSVYSYLASDWGAWNIA